LRTASEVAAAYFFLSALIRMPIANVSAILQALPLTVSLAGAVFLGEALGWRRLAAILIGFFGVLLIVKPGGADFNVYSLYAIAAVACVTSRDIIVRRMSKDVPSMFVAWVAGVGVMVFAGFASLAADWQVLSPLGQVQMVGSIVFIVAGYILAVTAMRAGEIAFVAPFRYVSLLVALILGFVFFAEIPDALTIIGASVVVMTGLFTLYREAKVKAHDQ
jgi:S-adenosylmethionine uptake transporter